MSGTKVVKRGKENAPPRADHTIDEDSDVHSKRRSTKPLVSSRSDEGGNVASSTTAELERVKRERDAFAKQLEELSKLKQTEQETAFEKYKREANDRARIQAQLIETATTLDEKRVSRISELERLVKELREGLNKANDQLEAAAAAPSLDSKIDGMGIKDLREEVFKLRKLVKARDEQVATLKTDLEAEIQHTQQLQGASSKASASSAQPPAEDNEKDTLSLGLYEDISGLAILGVSVKQTQKGRDTTFKCIQTYEDRTLAFKLRSFNEFDRDSKKWVKNIALVPENLQNETDKSFVKRLGPFAKGFSIPRDQLPAAWEQLRSRMSKDGQYRDPESR